MSDTRCLFCTHDNPVGSRFCNDCGSPLHLKPCPQCEAVSDFEAGACHQCGFAFASTSVQGQPHSSTPIATSDAQATLAMDAQPVVSEPNDERKAHVPETLAASLVAGSGRIGDVVPTSFGVPLTLRPTRSRYVHNATYIAMLVVAMAGLGYFLSRPSAPLNGWLAGVQLDVLGVVRANVAPASTARSGPSLVAAPASATVGATGAVAAPILTIPVESNTSAVSPAMPDDAASARSSTPADDPPAVTAAEEKPAANETADARSDEARRTAQPESAAHVSTNASPVAAPSRPMTSVKAEARTTGVAKAPQRAIAPTYGTQSSMFAPAPIVQPPPIATERPCTREIAALGLCESSGNR